MSTETGLTALVTGASSGLGHGLARALAKRGYRVVAAARRKAALDDLVAEIARDGGSAETLVLDVEDGEATFEKIRQLDQTVGLDLVVANAGWGEVTHAKRFRWSDVQRILRLNLEGAMATLLGALPGMIERKRGHLVGVSSLAAYRGLPGSGAYSASKAALNVYLESLRVDLRGSGVAVTTICPGFVATPLNEKAKDKLPFILTTEDAVERMVRGIVARKRLVSFPLPLVAGTRLLSMLPAPLYELLGSRAPHPKGNTKE